jgi:hypothetical protein
MLWGAVTMSNQFAATWNDTSSPAKNRTTKTHFHNHQSIAAWRFFPSNSSGKMEIH